MKIEVGKFYRTSDGAKARIYAFDGEGEYSIHGAIWFDKGWELESWTAAGTCADDRQDIVDYWRVTDQIRSLWEKPPTEDITHKLACDKIEELAFEKGKLLRRVEALEFKLREIKCKLLQDRTGLVFLYGEDFVRELEKETKGPQS